MVGRTPGSARVPLDPHPGGAGCESPKNDDPEADEGVGPNSEVP
jgi:hypothetical protein